MLSERDCAAVCVFVNGGGGCQCDPGVLVGTQFPLLYALTE